MASLLICHACPHDSFYSRQQLASAIKNKSQKLDVQIASTQEKQNSLLRRIKKWQEVQLVYMPGAGTAPLSTSEDDAEDDDIKTAENVPLLLPSSLDAERHERACLPQVAEYE